MRRRLRVWSGFVLAALVAGLGSAMMRPMPQDADTVSTNERRTQIREYLRGVMAKYRGSDGESYDRYLQRPREIDSPLRARLDPVANHDESRLHSLHNRSGLRAFDGAPPMMPHSRNYAAMMPCLGCHTDGKFLGSKFARPMSHAVLTNCLQCHVEARHLFLDFYKFKQTNDFVGLRAPQGGVRASTVAPPVMPHGTMMRVNCLACHGPNGYRGLRTEHPERLNCVQCHAVAAEADQLSPYFTGIPKLVLPRVFQPVEARGVVDPGVVDQQDP